MKKRTEPAKVVVDCDTTVHMLQASLESMANAADRLSSVLYATTLLPQLKDNVEASRDVRNTLKVAHCILEDLQNEIDFALNNARQTTGKQCVAFLVPDFSSAEVGAVGIAHQH